MTTTPEDKRLREIAEAAEFIRNGLEFAFRQGLHEIGDDPLAVLLSRIRELDEAGQYTEAHERLDGLARERVAEAESRALAAEARVLGLVEALKTIERVTTDFGAQDCAARALLSLAHGGVEGMGASRASRASEGLRPFASDSAAEVGGSE